MIESVHGQTFNKIFMDKSTGSYFFDLSDQLQGYLAYPRYEEITFLALGDNVRNDSCNTIALCSCTLEQSHLQAGGDILS